jgi:hypothetical protein
VPPRTVEVCGAGFGHANGLYDLNAELGLQDGRPVWSLACGHATLHVYRCALDNGRRAWFLSSTPRGRRPGTDADTDFYRNSSAASPAGRCPPRSAWTSCAPTYDPAPEVIDETEALSGRRNLHESMGTSEDDNEDDADEIDVSSRSSDGEGFGDPGAFLGPQGGAAPESPGRG